MGPKVTLAVGSRLVESHRRAILEARAFTALARAGVIGIESPWRIAAIAHTLRDYGAFGGAARIAALRHGERPAIADERGEITFAELDERVNRLANALCARGLGPGSRVGILCRNHRQPLVTAFAASRVGMDVIWLNTAFSGPQAKEVAEREGVELLVHDDDLVDIVSEIDPVHGRIGTAIEAPARDVLDRLIDGGDPSLPSPPRRPGRLVLLTSGTTGTPKGAARDEPRGFVVPGALLERMPLRARQATVVGPPLFHGTGLALAMLSISLGSKVVLRRRFEPAEFLDDVERHRATAVCVVPVMLQRVLGLGDGEIRRRDLSALRFAFCAGSQLPAEVATKTMDLLGDVIYNLYGSTEVSVATFATPADLRAAPTTVGKPALGSRVKLLDEHGREVPVGERGRIFVRSTTPFEGYTGGGGKPVIDGFLATGDVGHFDAEGRLYIDGRDDEMIISGGENLFPAEVEGQLLTHPAVVDAAVIGVEDADFGQRLRAFVVTSPEARVDGDELRALVKRNLARYKVPRDVIFIDEIPRNPTGKILKRVLAQHES